jgi:hypothetical protein
MANPQHPEHVDVDEYEDSPPTENPAAGAFTDIIVNVPENITIKMVNAAALGDYEIWVFIASLLSNAVVGFGVAYFQALDAKSASTSYIAWTWIVFFILWVTALLVAVKKRMSMRHRSKDIRLRTTSASEHRH